MYLDEYRSWLSADEDFEGSRAAFDEHEDLIRYENAMLDYEAGLRNPEGEDEPAPLVTLRSLYNAAMYEGIYDDGDDYGGIFRRLA